MKISGINIYTGQSKNVGLLPKVTFAGSSMGKAYKDTYEAQKANNAVATKAFDGATLEAQLQIVADFLNLPVDKIKALRSDPLGREAAKNKAQQYEEEIADIMSAQGISREDAEYLHSVLHGYF